MTTRKSGPSGGSTALAVALVGPVAMMLYSEAQRAPVLLPHIASGIVGGLLTVWLIPKLKYFFLKRGLGGKDLAKVGGGMVPEALGLVCGILYLVCVIASMLHSALGHPEKLVMYTAAALSICFMTLLGFADDVLDLPWRYKLMLPTVASLPLLVTYNGVTSVLMPVPVRPLLLPGSLFEKLLSAAAIYVDPNSEGAIVDLGLWYYVYMGLLAVFCTNSINIYAGVNGLEAGQSLVIAVFVLLTNLHEIHNGAPTTGWSPNLFSAGMMLPFIGVTLALLRYNWYPSSVFVGDTFCYFAGMTFAVVGILGHFSKTLLLLFIPQVLNFIYSMPQLFKIVPCPRHRLPRFDPKTGLLYPSTFVDKHGVERDNMTIICLVLRICGPMREETLTQVLCALQVVCCGMGLLLRYQFSQFVY